MKYGPSLEVVYCRVREEHPDNISFIKRFTLVTGIPVTIVMNEKYDGSIYNVFRDRQFIKSQHGAPCTGMLKKQVRQIYTRGDDGGTLDLIQVFGYTVDEVERAQRFTNNNFEVKSDFILIERDIDKKECFDWLQEIGLDLPVMYKLGYTNNNCIGCVKGGMGYWNKIRKDFPHSFVRMAQLEREIGHAVNKDKNGPIYLDELDPDRGVFKTDVPGDCGFTCEMK